MSQAKLVNIDFDVMNEMLQSSIRRAVVFMGVGINASESDPAISHVLARETLHQIKFVKDDVSAGEKIHVAHEFGKWVRANGIRELLESFSIFLGSVYSAAYYIHMSLAADGTFSRCTPSRFEKLGIGEQMSQLSDVLEVNRDDVRIVQSLNKVRNCYAHRQGRVGANDLAGDEFMTLVWLALRLEAATPDGNVILEHEIIGRLVEKGTRLRVHVVEQQKNFSQGAELILSKGELKEICLCMLTIGQRLQISCSDFARKVGIPGATDIVEESEPRAM
jgi:hypothetical protein